MALLLDLEGLGAVGKSLKEPYWDEAAQDYRDPVSGRLWGPNKDWSGYKEPDLQEALAQLPASEPFTGAANPTANPFGVGYEPEPYQPQNDRGNIGSRIGASLGRMFDPSIAAAEPMTEWNSPFSEGPGGALSTPFDPVVPSRMRYPEESAQTMQGEEMPFEPYLVSDFPATPTPLRRGISTAGRLLDQYVAKPLDWYSETGLASIKAGPFVGMAGPPGTGYNEPGDVIRRQQEGAEQAQGYIRDPASAVEAFRERPWYEQLGLGGLIDPTAPLPVVGFGPDILRAGKAVPRGLSTVGRVGAREVGMAADVPATRAGRALAGEMGGGDLSLASNVRRSLPGRAAAKVAPGGFEVTPGTAEQGGRVGDLLHLPNPAALGENYTPQQVLRVAGNAEKRVASVTNQLDAADAAAWRALGPQFKDEVGNIYLKNVRPSQAEIDAHLPGALKVRVVERPGEYALTPAQSEAVAKIGRTAEAVKNERNVLGAPVNELAMEEGEQYMHRVVLKPTETKQAEALVNAADPRANELLARSSPTPGGRLAIGKDKSRVFDDPIEGVKLGVVYGDPRIAARQNIEQGLTKAANAHTKALLEPFGQTAADRVDAGLRAAWNNATTRVSQLEGRLATAEKRAGLAAGRGQELQGPLAKLRSGVVDKPTAKAALAQAKKDLRSAINDVRATSSEAGRTGVLNQQAKRKLDIVLKRAARAEEKLTAQEVRLERYNGAMELYGLDGARTATAESEALVKDIQQAAQGARTAGRVTGPVADRELAAWQKAQQARVGVAGAAADARTATTEALAAAKADVPQEVHTAISQMERRITALRARGDKWSGLADSLDQELAKAKDRAQAIEPIFRKAVDASKTPLPGRRGIPMEVAPALMGTDFDKKTAARIIAHYGGGIRIGSNVIETRVAPVRALNKLLIPVNATGDFSVTLNQLAMAGASRPIQFATNLVKSMRDMVDDTNYSRWLASKPEASRFVTILGGGQGSDFTSPWLERVPVFKQAQKQFQRFGNRMRVDAWESVVKTTEASNKAPVDDLAKEQIGRAVDRVTGIARSKATDAETLAQFAPNFLRSIIETVGYAAMDGSLEGQVARQYLKNYVALGGAMVAGVAAYQGRDLAEVLTPFDKKAWANGQIRLNSNFMSVRVAGQDIKVFGTYDSAVALLVALGDAGYRSVTEKDAMQLFDFLGYAGSTKGSPVLRFITDLIKGETFSGEAPLSTAATAARVMPITGATALQDYQKGMSAKDLAIDVGLSSLGVKSNPVTAFEKMDEWSKENKGSPYSQLDPLQREEARKANNYESTNKDAREADRVTAELRKVNVARQEEIDKLGPGENWREQYNDLKQRMAGQWEARDVLDPFTGTPYTSPMDKAIEEWSQVMATNTKGTKTDWDAVERWEAQNPEKASFVDQYLSGKENKDLSPLVTRYRAETKAIADSGYFDGKDKIFADPNWGPRLPGYEQGDTYDTWYQRGLAEYIKVAQERGYQGEGAVDKAKEWIEVLPFKKTFDDGYKKYVVRPWFTENPEAAVLAWRWGYYDPPKEIEEWLILVAKELGQ